MFFDTPFEHPKGTRFNGVNRAGIAQWQTQAADAAGAFRIIMEVNILDFVDHAEIQSGGARFFRQQLSHKRLNRLRASANLLSSRDRSFIASRRRLNAPSFSMNSIASLLASLITVLLSQ